MKKDVKKTILQSIYDTYAAWTSSLAFACSKGCFSCCTQSVTMTTLEGEDILGYLQKGRPDLSAKVKNFFGKIAYPTTTTNQYAADCLNKRTGDDLENGSWNFGPCIFLEKGCCAIYPFRPFGCRSFVSLSRCDLQGSAEIPSFMVTINTMVLQIIEHLDRGRPWGNMLAILREGTGPYQKEKKGGQTTAKKETNLLVARGCPGFLVPPEDEGEANKIFTKLMEQKVGKTPIGSLLGLGA